MAEYDLTPLVSQYLDRHLVFPLLEFLSVKGLYDENDMLRGKLELLHNTNMVDFAIDIHKQLHDDMSVPDRCDGGDLRLVGERHTIDPDPEDMTTWYDKRLDVMEKLTSLKERTNRITAIFSFEDVTKKIQEIRDSESLLSYLKEKHGFENSDIDTIYEFAKFQYECGSYQSASEFLDIVRMLLSPNHQNVLNTQWGKLASTILMQDWESALDEVNKLRETIDSSIFPSSLESLMQRAWLIHWSLFVYFNHPNGKDYIIDLFLNKQQYVNAIQTLCPHILRYLTTAVITNKTKRRAVLKDLVKVIQQEAYSYRDPITEFIECLYVNFDFDGAQQKLRECDTVLENDFFLVECRYDFLENARILIFEMFCRIHQCISIDMLAEKLNMSSGEAEHWIVDLVRNAHLDAKIDSKLGHVVMGTQAVSPYQQVIEKTKALSIKSQLLAVRTGVKFNEQPVAQIPMYD